MLFDLGQLLLLAAPPPTAPAAENRFLRNQLALFKERKINPHRAKDSTRWMMATLSRMFQWRDAMVNVKPDTLIRRHRKGFWLFSRWKSKPTGRLRLRPANARTARAHSGCERPTTWIESIARCEDGSCKRIGNARSDDAVPARHRRDPWRHRQTDQESGDASGGVDRSSPD